MDTPNPATTSSVGGFHDKPVNRSLSRSFSYSHSHSRSLSKSLSKEEGPTVNPMASSVVIGGKTLAHTEVIDELSEASEMTSPAHSALSESRPILPEEESKEKGEVTEPIFNNDHILIGALGLVACCALYQALSCYSDGDNFLSLVSCLLVAFSTYLAFDLVSRVQAGIRTI